MVLDLYARRSVGWAVAPTLDQHLAHEPLAMALVARQPARGLLFHSDRGGAFLSWRVQYLAQEAGVVLSTSRPGRCLDNAVAESFLHALKTELVYQHRYHMREESHLAVVEYIVAFHNRVRRHLSNGYPSADEQEGSYVANNP